ncbi:MAG: glycosyltransferase family 4 protein [bacterium]
MKICITHYAFYPTTGGVESHLLDLCTELARKGHEVHALVGSDEASPSEKKLQGFTIHRRKLMNSELVRDLKNRHGFEEDKVWPALQTKIKKLYEDFIQRRDLDLIHAHNFHHFLPEYGLALTELHEQGISTFLTVHEVWSEFICEDLLQQTKWNKVITVSRHVEEGIREQAPHLDNLRLIYHGIDTELFSPQKSPSKEAEKLSLTDKPVVIHPARMLPWKGVIYSVEAMEILQDSLPEAVLIITDTDNIVDWNGELGDYKKRVLERIKDKGLEDNIITQSFNYPDLPGIYNCCDVVIYPTIGEEPFGLVPLEGMACGKPVVVTKSGGLVESVIDRKTGFVIEKRDPKTLAEKIELLLKDKKLARQMRKAGRRHVVENFSCQRMTQELIELYEEALAEN